MGTTMENSLIAEGCIIEASRIVRSVMGIHRVLQRKLLKIPL